MPLKTSKSPAAFKQNIRAEVKAGPSPSDPTFDVSTPTGVLQGVAAFSWDGSNWQPSASAGPSVATPTGVLRGVAPFSYSGGVWTPTGRAGPGVATPTGVLDGVAVYTWSGSAWTPSPGGPDTATPTGVLQGVAAFYWDGTNWQPTGQAGPDVATPSGVLQGVAMFSWSGSAWVAASAGPPGVTLDLSFMNPGTLPTGVTLSRASTATYFNSVGTMQTAAVNAPRWDYNPSTLALNGMLIEEARTNICINSPGMAGWTLNGVTRNANAGTAPDGTATATKFVETTGNTGHYSTFSITTVASTTYCNSVFASSAGTRYLQLVCDDGTNGAYATFDLVAGTISGPITARGTGTAIGATIQPISSGVYRCSVAATLGALTTGRIAVCLSNVPNPALAPAYVGNTANSVLMWGPQMEAGAFPTSYIPTTGAAVTRSQDVAAIPPTNMGFYVSPGGSWAAEFISNSPVNTNTRVLFVPPGPGSVSPAYINSSAQGGEYNGTVVIQAATPFCTVGAVSKIATTATAAAGTVCLNAGPVGSGTWAAGFPTVATAGIAFLGGVGGGTDNMSGYMRRLRYWPRVLTNTELQQVTT